MIYQVNLRLAGDYCVEIKADNPSEAAEKARFEAFNKFFIFNGHSNEWTNNKVVVNKVQEKE